MKSAFAFSLALALLLAAGCQRTPAESIVTGKSSDDLIEKASAETVGSLAERLAAPEHYADAFSSTGGELQVTVDAAVTVPDADAAPILRVTPAEISQSQADTLLETLVRGTLCSTEQQLTKEDIAAEILTAKQELAEGPAEDDIFYQTEGLEAWQQSRQDHIDALQSEYDRAPDTAGPLPISGEFEENADGLRQIWGEDTGADGSHEELRIVNGPFGQAICQAFFSRNAADDGLSLLYAPAGDMESVFQTDVSQVPDVTVTEDDARSLCDDLVQALDIDGMSCRSLRRVYSQPQTGVPIRCCWELHYTRELGGIPVTYTDDSWVAVAMTPGGSYQAPWPYESILFYVNDDGVAGMKWLSPYELGETVTEDSALLPFSDVMDVFEKMYVVDNDGAEKDVTVSSIRLGYTRVLEQDEPGAGLLVPAWDFFGVTTDEEDSTYDDPDRSLLTINAIDGTIIDRNMGY